MDAAVRAAERQTLLEEVADELEEHALDLRGEPLRSGEVGIEYINGIEDAAGRVREAAQPHPGDDLAHIYVHRRLFQGEALFDWLAGWIFQGGYGAYFGSPANPPDPAKEAPIAYGYTPRQAERRGIKAAYLRYYDRPPLRDTILPPPPWWKKP
jgi:hypothetical protein